MVSFKKYFTHRVRSSLILTLVLCLLAVIIIQFSVSIYMANDNVWYDDDGNILDKPIEVRRLRIHNFGTVAFILGAICTVAPVLELSGFKNKRNADTLYALPVSRQKVALAHYLSGLLQIFAVYTCAYISLAVCIFTSDYVSELTSVTPFILCYFVLLIIGAGVYSIFTAIFNAANTVPDGCLFIAVWSVLPALFAIALIEFDANTDFIILRDFGAEFNEEMFMPHAALNIVNYFYSKLIGTNAGKYYIGYSIFWTAVGALLAVVYFLTFQKKRAEEIGEHSNTVFGYKVLIPIGLFSMTQAVDDKLISAILGILMAVVGYMLYRRSFKIKRNDLIVIAAIVAFTSISMSVLG